MNFQWCNLKIHLLPTVMQEIELISRQYIGINKKYIYNIINKI